MMKKFDKGLVDEIYNDLMENHLGKGASVKRSEYAARFGLSEREMRSITHEINESLDYEGLISTSTALYMCGDKSECLKAAGVTYRSAFTLLRKARKMAEKIRRNGQFKFDGNDLKMLISYFTQEKKEDGMEAKNGDNDEE